MDTQLALLDRPPAPAAPGDSGSDGFFDCRGVLHLWSEDDD
jgi:hypothetical protein